MKTILKEKAIELRKESKTYSQILAEVPVAKSTLSLWLREVGLSKSQKQVLTSRRREAQARGARRKREIRIEKTERILEEESHKIGKISKRELWLIGTALYWAEGAKEKIHRTGSMVDFMNSDHRMIKLYLRWLIEVVGIKKDQIYFGIYIHERAQNKMKDVISHWSKCTGFPEKEFQYIYLKKHNPKTKRKNVGALYYGMLRVRVRNSTDLNRRIAGWTKGVCQACEIV